MTMNDPQKLAALAALVGITPETHPHLKNGYCTCGKPDCPEPLTFNLPAIDTPAGDDVFLAPVIRWCGGGSNSKVDMWIEQWASNLTTMELIERCQSARVPEIVAIFGEGET